MAGRYKAYPECKDIAGKWLDAIPIHWNFKRLGYEASLQGGYAFASGAFQPSGIPVVRMNNLKRGILDVAEASCVAEKNCLDAFALEEGDLLFGMSGSVGETGSLGNYARVRAQDLPAQLNQRVGRFCISEGASSLGFLSFVIQTQLFYDQILLRVTGTAQLNVSSEQIESAKLPFPPLPEQKQIAHFLDHETGKIDALIEKQQALIALLQEKRQAVISHAVTKGLNPETRMKDSGVEWLGEVPEGWIVRCIKHQLKSLNNRRIPLSSEERGDRSGEYDYYGASGVIDHIDDYIFDEPTILIGEDGANLVNRSTPLAFSARGKYWVNNHAHILKANDGLVDYWAEAIEHIDINPIVSGSAQPKLTAEALGALKICFPSSAQERDAINGFIKEQKARFDTIMSKARTQVNLLQERRTALISAAVTGKIDVRDWEPTSEA